MTAGSIVVVVVEVVVVASGGCVELSLAPDGTLGTTVFWVIEFIDRQRLRRSVREAEHTYFFPFEATPTRPEAEQNAPGVTGDPADATATNKVEPRRENRATASNLFRTKFLISTIYGIDLLNETIGVRSKASVKVLGTVTKLHRHLEHCDLSGGKKGGNCTNSQDVPSRCRRYQIHIFKALCHLVRHRDTYRG